MPALLLGTICGLLCAGVAHWAGAGTGLVVLVHAVCGAAATLAIAWLQFTAGTRHDARIPDADADPVA